MGRGAVGKPIDGPVSRHINRRISRRISGFILRYWRSPEPSLFTIISTIIGVIVYPLYLVGYPLIAGLVAQLASIIDGVDGEIARALGKVSRFGGFVDSILDRIVDICIVLGVSAYHALYVGAIFNLDPYLIGFIGVSLWLLVSYIHGILRLEFGRDAELEIMFPRIATRDVRIFIIFIFSIVSMPIYGLLITIILSIIHIILLGVYLWGWLR